MTRIKDQRKKSLSLFLSINVNEPLLYSEPVPHCLSHVKLIPPCDRILLEMAFCELSKWAIYTLRSSLLEADIYFKQKGINPTLNYNAAVKVWNLRRHIVENFTLYHFVLFLTKNYSSVADPGVSRRGVLIYYFGKFSPKLHKNEINWAGGFVPCTPHLTLDPPLRLFQWNSVKEPTTIH